MRTLPVVIAALTLTFAAHAQDKKPELTPEQQDQHKFGYFSNSPSHVDIVTLADPNHRIPCHIKHHTQDTLTCHGAHGLVPHTYKREEISAVIAPPTHAQLWRTIAFCAAGAGVIAASVFVPVTAIAVIMQVGAGIGIFSALVDGIDRRTDHDDDLIVYQRHETPLQLTLNPGK